MTLSNVLDSIFIRPPIFVFMMTGFLLHAVLLVLGISYASCQSRSGERTEGTAQKNDSARAATEVEHSNKHMNMNSDYTVHLSDQEYRVLAEKATDRPGNGGYTDLFEEGVYHCRACGTALYSSSTKFHSGCGWPSFDAELPGAVERHVDRSVGMVRTEIVCATCGGHLGHVFEGEHFTSTNTRHCVNTSSLIFHPKITQSLILAGLDVDQAQFEFQVLPGVLQTEIGLASLKNESAKQSAIKVVLDPRLLNAEAFASKLSDLKQNGRLNVSTLQSYATEAVAEFLRGLSARSVSCTTNAEADFQPSSMQEQHKKLRASRPASR